MNEYYGNPRSSDCEQLLYSFANYKDNQGRLFDEEQLRTAGRPSFPGVPIAYSSHVFQLPAYWSLSQSSQPLTQNPSEIIMTCEYHRNLQHGPHELRGTSIDIRRSWPLQLATDKMARRRLDQQMPVHELGPRRQRHH